MLTFAQIRKGFKTYRSRVIPNSQELANPIKGMIVHVLEKINEGERGRKIVLMWLFQDLFKTLDEVSVKKLSPADWYALYRWVAPYKIETNKYGFRDGLEEECAAIWYYQSRIIGDIKENHDDTKTVHTQVAPQ